MSDTTQPRKHFFFEEKPGSLGKLPGHVLVWLVILGFGFVISIFIASGIPNGQWLIFLDVVVSAVIFVMVSFKMFEKKQTTAMTIVFRKTERGILRLRGHLRQTLPTAEAGEVLRSHHANTDSTASNGKKPTTHTAKKPLTEADKNPNKKVLNVFGDVRFMQYTSLNNTLGPFGIAVDNRYKTISATMELVGTPISSVPQSQQDSFLDAYAEMLDMFVVAGLEVYRVVWSVETFPGETQDPKLQLQRVRKQAGLDGHGRNDDELLEYGLSLGQDSWVHHTTMTITVRQKSGDKNNKRRGSSEETLAAQLSAVNANLAPGSKSPMGIQRNRILSYDNLIVENGLRLDPVFVQRHWEQLRATPDETSGLRQSMAWPDSVDFASSPHYCRLGESYLCGMYVANFNPLGMTTDHFHKLIGLNIQKTVTVVIKMVPTAKAQQTAERRASARRIFNIEQLVKGNRVKAAYQVDEERAMEHERKVAEGKHQTAIGRIYTHVYGTTPDEAQDNQWRLIDAAKQGRFVIKPLTDRQQFGAEILIPAGRGLDSKSFTEAWDLAS